MHLAAALFSTLPGPTISHVEAHSGTPQALSDQAIKAWAEMQCSGMLSLEGTVYDTYVDSVLSIPMTVVSIAIHGVRSIEEFDSSQTLCSIGAGEIHHESHVCIDDLNPEFFSVYVEDSDGRKHCIGDFDLPGWAREFAAKQAQRLGCPVLNHLPNRLI